MVIDKVALTLTVIGALNWGSIGQFGFNIVAYLCGVWCITMLFRETEPIEGDAHA